MDSFKMTNIKIIKNEEASRDGGVKRYTNKEL